MTLPASGPLSLSDIQTEFGGAQPISMSEYYKGGPYVNEYSLAPHVPESGPIAISDFYGASHYVPTLQTVTLADGQSFTVPTTIQSTLLISVIAGAGGVGGNDVSPGYPGYPGRIVQAYITFSAGDIILASVGGAGVGGGSGAGAGTGGTGGYGGIFGYTGGPGGNAGPQGWSGGGGGGGGASAVKHNGSIVAVAGGGAGGGGGGWHSAGRPTQGYSSTGTITGGPGVSDPSDGGGGGGGGAGQFGGQGGTLPGGDNGAYSGSTGADLVPAGGSSTISYDSPSITIQGTW